MTILYIAGAFLVVWVIAGLISGMSRLAVEMGRCEGDYAFGKRMFYIAIPFGFLSFYREFFSRDGDGFKHGLLLPGHWTRKISKWRQKELVEKGILFPHEIEQ